MTNRRRNVRTQQQPAPQGPLQRFGPSRQGSSLDQDSLQERLPGGSVYLWAAKLDGASSSDVVVGWTVLLVSEVYSFFLGRPCRYKK